MGKKNLIDEQKPIYNSFSINFCPVCQNDYRHLKGAKTRMAALTFYA